MAADGASGVAVGISIKAGLLAAAVAAIVSLVATLVGFTVVPLAPGRELLDATRRLCAGLLASATLGPLVALQVFENWPTYLIKVMDLIGGHGPERLMWAYLTAAVPFIALSGIVGFWIVAAAMRFFTKRQDADLLDMARDVREALAEHEKGKP